MHLVGNAQFVQAAGGIGAAAGDEAMDRIVFFQQPLRQIGAVLAGDAGD